MSERLIAAIALLFAASACFTTACSSDNPDKERIASSTTVDGQSVLLRLGGIELFIPGTNVGVADDQIPPNAVVAIQNTGDISESTAVAAIASGERVLSPTYTISVTQADGTDISSRALATASRVTIFPEPGAMASSGSGIKELQLIKVSSGVATSLNYSDTPVDDMNYVLTGDGWIEASVTNFSDFLVMSGGTPASGGGGGGSTTVALTGTLQNLGGLAYILTLSDSTTSNTITCNFPAGAVASLPANVQCNVTTFSADLNNRAVVVNAGGVQYTTTQTGASVLVQVDALSGEVSSGEITGVAIADDSSSFTLDYTFTTAAASGSTTSDKTLAVTASSQLDVNAGDANARLGRIVFNGTEFVALWTTGAAAPYSIATRNISSDGTLQGSEGGFTPTAVNFSSATDLEAAFGNDTIMLASASATDNTGDVVALILDQNGNPMGTAIELTVQASAGAPRVAYNATEGAYAIAFELNAGGIGFQLYDDAGTAIGSAGQLSSDANAELRGIAGAADGSEFLVTWTDGTGILARRINASDGSVLGTADISFSATTTTGGACGYDQVGDGYLVTYDEGGTLQIARLSIGEDTPSDGVALSIIGGADRVVGGSVGSVVVGAVNIFQGVEANSTSPLVMSGSVIPFTSGISATFHTSSASPGIAANGTDGFMVLGVDDQNDGGVRVFRMTISE